MAQELLAGSGVPQFQAEGWWEPGCHRVRRYYRRVQEVAPPVAEVIASSEPLARLLAGKGSEPGQGPIPR